MAPVTPPGRSIAIRITDVIGHGPHFVDTLGPVVQAASRDGVVLRLDAGPPMFNHLGGPHAAAIFGLGETAAFALLLEVFGDLVDAGGVPLVGKVEISYTDIVVGPVIAATQPLANEEGTRGRYAEKGVASFPVEVVFVREQDQVETGRATYRMAVKKG